MTEARSREEVPPPLGLLAELTHRCPLHCPYCSNPVELVRRQEELSTQMWQSVFEQARALGVLQVHLSGGEPLARSDLPELVEHAHSLGHYLNLVTSGLALSDSVTEDLASRGLDHVQLSIQDSDPRQADATAGTRAHAHKLRAAGIVTRAGLPLTVNVVLHRGNLDRLDQIIELAGEMGADRLELANTQYYGWALRNRQALLPTADQLRAAEPIVQAARERFDGRMDIAYVVADYYADYPKPCMHGWGGRQLTISPDGDVLPCPAATVIPGLRIENITQTTLAEIWYDAPSFNAFRGTDWMREPCRSCSRRELDFGGCRCQAYQLTGDPANTDPVCTYSPHRSIVDEIIGNTDTEASLEMRTMGRSR